jgi:phosphoglycolate phosphatase-like HAD superfamily hydrolase
MDGIRIRAVIFDLDGTLADTVPVCFTAFRSTLKEFTGRDYENAEIEALFGPDEMGVLRKILPDAWKPALLMYLKEYEANHDLCTAPFPGVIGLLDWLRDHGLRVAIVTGKGKQSAAISLRRIGLTSHFDVVEAGSPMGAVKAAAIKSILDRWGLATDQAVYVGDTAYDMRAAREAGVLPLAAMWAATAHRDRVAKEKPAASFDSVDALQNWISERIKG